MTIFAAQKKQETKHFWETLKVVGRNVKTKRMQLRLTTRQFAPKMGLTQSSVTWIEGGKKRVPLTWIVNAADALGVQVHLLFMPDAFGPMPKPRLRSAAKGR